MSSLTPPQSPLAPDPATLIGDGYVEPEAVEQMQAYVSKVPTTRWAVYQNHDDTHLLFEHLRFLAVGPDNIVKAPPPRFPDSHLGVGWRYRFVGWVDMDVGQVVSARIPRELH